MGPLPNKANIVYKSIINILVIYNIQYFFYGNIKCQPKPLIPPNYGLDVIFMRVQKFVTIGARTSHIHKAAKYANLHNINPLPPIGLHFGNTLKALTIRTQTTPTKKSPTVSFTKKRSKLTQG